MSIRSHLRLKHIHTSCQPPPTHGKPGWDKLNKQIARNLGLSHQHVRNTLSEIYVKLGVKGRMGVAKLMREKGIDRLD
jgi:hypothetical protein